ncbi:MAG: Flp family type IVb pilin [Kiritimatiellae bacterium]|nr:Flp family type IVb pilin [Kiritimatiellia bacterium]
MKKTKMLGSREGATFIEYALLAGLVAIVVAAAAMFFGEDLKELFGATGKQTKDVSENVSKVDLHDTFDNNSGE